jgi:hypothetical protein
VLDRLTYANITATVALFLALGGTGWAAARLARNSVGPAQIRTNAVGAAEIRTGAVRTNELRNGSIALDDLSTTARDALRGPAGARGPTGPEGPRGPQGPQGPSAPTAWAAINHAGQRVAGNAIRADHFAVGAYAIDFNRNVEACPAHATVTRVPGDTEPAPGLISLRPERRDHRVDLRRERSALRTLLLPGHQLLRRVGADA